MTKTTSAAPTLTIAHIDSSFHPALGAKFSPNLYAFLSNSDNRSLAVRAQVYRAADDGALWIGYWFDGDFIGTRLSSVLCYGYKVTIGSFSSIGPLTEIPDFWDRYAAVGRCAIDVVHKQVFKGSETRWRVAGDTRSCLWCGAVTQRRRRWTETVVHESWATAPATGDATGD